MTGRQKIAIWIITPLVTWGPVVGAAFLLAWLAGRA